MLGWWLSGSGLLFGTRGQGIVGEVLAALATPEGRANPIPSTSG
jgi:hypothetical protein